MNSKKKISLILGITLVLVVMVALGSSYALFRFNITNNTNFKVISGTLSLVINDSETDRIVKNGMIPETEASALSKEGYTFTITNNGTLDSGYIVYLDDINIETDKQRLSSNVVNVNIENNATHVKTTYKLSELSDRILVAGTLNKNESVTYTLRIWLDIKADNTSQNKYYAGKIRVVGKQVNDKTLVYKEALLNGADPVLTDNLIPVIIDDHGTVRKAGINEKWYSYENKQWANSVVLKDKAVSYTNGEVIPEANIQSYFVWIPKYSYQLFNTTSYTTYSTTDYTDPVNGKDAINIRFGIENTSDTNDGECTTSMTEGNIGNCQEGDYMTHPAFISIASNGLWVGKFETGYEGSAPGNNPLPNRVVVKPNVYSWRSINVGNIFKTSIEYMPSEDSHMMKNTEWGAMAYLTNSIYGTCTASSCQEVRINNNRSYVTGFAGTEAPTLPYNGGTSIEGNRVEAANPGVDGTYTINYLNTSSVIASTTLNYTGIYDTSGGAFEYVAGYTINANSTTFNETTGAATNGDLSGITGLYNDFYNNSTYSKYWDKYTSTANTHWNKRILGDATGELGPFIYTEDLDLNSQGTAYNRRLKSNWYHDYARFVFSSYPWFSRGGVWNLGIEAGPFAFSVDTGVAYSNYSFRLVLAPKATNSSSNYELASSELDSNNQITLQPNTTKEFTINITSQINEASKYQLYYQTSAKDRIEVGYTSNTVDNPTGNIAANGTKQVRVVVRNNSNKVNGTVTFGVQGGRLDNELVPPDGTLLTEKNLYKEDLLNGADPVLTTNLVPVTISNTGIVTKVSVFNEWYSYEDKNWANIVKLKSTASDYSVGATIPESAIESYFVWIPKYAYKLFNLTSYTTYSETDYTDPVNGKNPINIRFGLDNTNDSNTGECTTPIENNQGISGNIGNCHVNDYMTHPAFISMNTNGLWVGKFETGYDGAATVGQAQQGTANKDKVIIKPNVYSWRSINVGNIFKTSIEYMPSEDSHMMKNTEWGAMAYLTNSIYGTCTENSCSEVRINNNRSFVTGYAGTEQPTLAYNGETSIEGNRNEAANPGVDGTYTINYLNTNSQVASTTLNYTGIYDTAGGSWEYVAGYTTGATTDNSTITTLYTDFYNDSTYLKYWDKYSSTSWVHWNKRILGDATGELGPFIYTEDLDLNSGGTAYNKRPKSNWYHDYAFFVFSGYPWFRRGGAWTHGIGAGAFAFNFITGGADSYNSFRIVLSPTE